MITVTIYEAHHGSGKQAIKLRAAFMRRHAVGVQGIGAFHLAAQGGRGHRL